MLEREILGCLLKDNALIHETIIQTEWFTDKGNRQLFDVMRKLSLEDKTVDKVTLLTETYGSIDINLINNIETIGNVENFESYEKQFIEQYKKEKAESITKHWLSDKQRQTSTLTEKLQQLEELGITDEQDKNTILMNLLEQLHSDEPVNTGVKTGLTELDNYLGGFQKTNSYILGARPSMGKTATMLKFALSALEQRVVPIIFSIEMSKEGLLRRLISTVAHINSFYSRNPQNLTDSQKENYTTAVNELYKSDFEIFDAPVQTIAYMRSQIRKTKRKYPDKEILIMIDYLTLITATERYNSKHDEVTAISAQLKAMAREYDCPVLTLAQLSRGVESRNDKRPLLSDLRESGSIEQDADVVMFLYRESYYNDETDDETLEINVAKHRDGPTGTAKVYYNQSTGKMADLSKF